MEGFFAHDSDASIKVPSCIDCNRKKAGPEGELRSAVLIADGVLLHPVAQSKFYGPFRSAVEKNLSPYAAAMRRAAVAPVRDRGIYYGKYAIAEGVPELDLQAMRYIVRGLHLFHTGQHLSTECTINVSRIPPYRRPLVQGKFFALPGITQQSLGQGVVEWAFMRSQEDSEGSIWLFTFYEAASYLLGTGSLAKFADQSTESLESGSERQVAKRLKRLGLSRPSLIDDYDLEVPEPPNDGSLILL